MNIKFKLFVYIKAENRIFSVVAPKPPSKGDIEGDIRASGL
jgi:hypothetical protein